MQTISHPRGPALEWALWSTTMRLVTSEERALPAAKRLVDHELQGVELAASRFRHDSEVARLARSGGRPVRVSPTMLALTEAAVAAAVVTHGACDPTVGTALERLGYGRDLEGVGRVIPTAHGTIRLVERPAPGWRRVRIDRAAGTVTVPADVTLDLGATAKAWAADRCARIVAEQLGTGVLVALGGDIATAGPAPAPGWTVSVQDLPDDPAALVSLPSGWSMATSSTRRRRWQVEGRELNHILDPATSLPVVPHWSSASVAAPSCVLANAWSTAALVTGPTAPGLLAGAQVQARLLDLQGDVTYVGGWPADAEGVTEQQARTSGAAVAS
ncbi:MULTISPECIES: FAD:protein FMN transferase [Arsenicicoccus]|uniref:FAD:protein FMN transferase n=1 Tax=Arsenicicoccus bolidensis TaxID=229480 RepID=A0ABS9Q081_9MICO|nr:MULTISPECIES: FAD:protein FMN transferase [Arsenicicoccus]MCG7320488.1 FAD:protein FMN transferase [Arsenicicoccus bolidensis]